jgi:predicted DNA-binding protein (UPF0251 family)
VSAGMVPSIYAVSDATITEALLFDEASVEGEDLELTNEDERGEELSPNSDSWGADRDLWMYRDRTQALLRRYARLSVEVGRLPSVLGREFFRAKITSYHMSTFEDTVIFVHDVEQSLDQLDGFRKKLVGMVVLEEYSQEEAARLLQISPRTVGRYIYEAIDGLSEIFLRGSILKPIGSPVSKRETACQGGESDQFSASNCNEGKNNF